MKEGVHVSIFVLLQLIWTLGSSYGSSTQCKLVEAIMLPISLKIGQ